MSSGTLTSGDCYTTSAIDALDACCTLALGTFSNQTYTDFNASYPGALGAGDVNATGTTYVGRCDFDDNGNRMSDCLKQREGQDKVWCFFASGVRRAVSAPGWVLLALVASSLLAL